jgi:ubiquinone/menaquinone biosynthesis C-methylase UbiE
MAAPVYDAIGRNFNTNRRADPRLVRTVIELLRLPQGARLADIGAGTGNYANAMAASGYLISAVEPSSAMREQATPLESVAWHDGRAEEIPLPPRSVDGIYVILAVHHFSDVRKAGQEFSRICPAGPIVIFTIDPRAGDPFWFGEYFPGIHAETHRIFPPLDRVAEDFIAGGGGNLDGEVVEFPLPADFADLNMNTGWNRPELYLDPSMRQNTSGFALADPAEVDAGIARLRDDLASGAWDDSHGELRHHDARDLGFRFLRFTASD